MKILNEVSESDVWQHWKQVESFNDDNFRSDIRDPLPKDLKWFLAEVENADLDRLYIISSGDWSDISDGTYRVRNVVNNLNQQSTNLNTQRIIADIRKKMEFLDGGGELDTRLIAVTNLQDLSGPFTFIEGNRRSVTFFARNAIVGCHIYIGVSSEIISYGWARKSFAK